jgi:pyruvate dehydrogenase E2 component (dihydrolipoamide acetyltransferase)
MVSKVVMPKLSLTMKEGTVVQWFKKEGETVQKGDPLVEVLSEKVTYDVEAPASGTIRKVLALEGENVPVDQTLAIVAAPEEDISEALAKPTLSISAAETAPAALTKEKTAEAAERSLASPAAKRLARELDVNLAQVRGTGPEGRIVEEDVKIFAEQSKVMTARIKQVIPLSGIRKITAERLSYSARTAPHSTITMEVDMTNAIKLHEQMNVSYTDILVKAAATALKAHPMINSTLENDEIRIFEDVNVGVAIATDKGLVVPVIRDANTKTLSQISATMKNLVEKGRAGRLTKEDLTGGTFTITNLGMYGVDVFIPIINPPEAAILGVGRLVERPVSVNNEIRMQPTMQLSLAFDHRIIDGAPAASFLQKIKQIIEGGFGRKS